MGTLNKGALCGSIVMLVAIIHSGIAQDCKNPLADHLLFAKKNSIVKLDLNGENEEILAISPMPITLDYDENTDTIYWSDMKSREIYSLALGQSTPAKVLVPKQDDWLPFGIAVEPVTGKLYVADVFSGTVKIFDLKNPKNERIAVGTDLFQPKDLAVDLKERYLFILDKYWILRTDIDGSNPKIIYEEHISIGKILEKLPSVLKNILTIATNKVARENIFKVSLSIADVTVDPVTKRIYWLNTQTRTLESSDYEGDNRKIHFQAEDGSSNEESFSSITFLDGCLYWADSETMKIYKVTLSSGKVEILLKNQELNPLSIKAIGCSTKQPTRNPCIDDNGQCQQMCVLSRGSQDNYKCSCNIGYELTRDGNSCSSVENYLLFTQNEFLRARSLKTNENTSVDVINPSKFRVGSGASLDYDADNQLIYYTSYFPNNRLHQVNLVTGENTILKPDLLSKDTYRVTYDWITRNLYYMTYYYADMNSLSVLNTRDPIYSKIVIEHVPRLVTGLVVHPNRGYLYIAQFIENKGVISRVNTDGTGLTVLYENDGANEIGSLAIDYDDDRLYWSEYAERDNGSFDVKVRHSNHDGKDIKDLSLPSNIKPVSSMAFHKNTMYAIIDSKQTLISLNKRNGLEMATLVDGVEPSSISGLKVAHRDIQSIRADHPCALEHGCEKFCFAVAESNGSLRAACGCPYGKKIADDGKTCVDNGKEEPTFLPCKYTSFKCNKTTDNVLSNKTFTLL